MVTVLCVRKRSVYKEMGLDCYDADRDMRTFAGGNAIVAHPPCAQWGQLSHLKHVKKDESVKMLAVECVHLVRKWGGILEHPQGSRLFERAWSGDRLPFPGIVDHWGGYTISVNQHWFGHRATKRTFLYICGCPWRDLPPIPYSLDAVTGKINDMGKREREHTPRSLAEFMVAVAEICDQNFKLKYNDSSRINQGAPAPPA